MNQKTLSAILLFAILLVGAYALSRVFPPTTPVDLPPIAMDGYLDEWEAYPLVHTDPAGDAGFSGLDFGALKVAEDETHVYIYVELGQETNLQTDSGVVLELSTDTGSLTYNFGLRRGRWNGEQIRHEDIGLVTAPTVTSDTFEIALAKDALPLGDALFSSDTFTFAFHEQSDENDLDADHIEPQTHTFSETPSPPPEPLSLAKTDPTHLRVVSYNVLRDNFTDDDYEAYFERILLALDPDVIGFQELYSSSAKRVERRLEEIFPDVDWYVVKGGDTLTASRYPIIQRWANTFRPLLGAFTPALIQVNDDTQILLFNAHLRCCDDDEGRQTQVDSFAALLRDMHIPDQGIEVPENLPLVLVGDLNLVGDAQQLDTLLNGNIQGEERFGEDALPDWDDSPLTDLVSRHTNSRMGYTWEDYGSGFSPGRLDFIIYTDSVLDVAHHYILHTRTMTDEQLAQYGLQRDDVASASDHLPHVVDFVLP